jgi:dihydrofolate reductase
MSRVTLDMSMSLDGFATGPNEGVGNPLGDDDGRLHAWVDAAKTEADAEVLDEIYATTGAIVIGKRMFDVGVEPWGDPPPFGMPVFVLTHEAREPQPMQGGTTYEFVSDGLEDALARAREAAGERNVGIWGGPNIAQQYLEAGLVDELQIHLSHLLLGQGVRLFGNLDGPIELEQTRTIAAPSATHMRFSVRR